MPPARSMKRRGRTARKWVAFRNDPVVPTVKEVTPSRPPLPTLLLIPLMPRKVLKILDAAAVVNA